MITPIKVCLKIRDRICNIVDQAGSYELRTERILETFRKNLEQFLLLGLPGCKGLLDLARESGVRPMIATNYTVVGNGLERVLPTHRHIRVHAELPKGECLYGNPDAIQVVADLEYTRVKANADPITNEISFTIDLRLGVGITPYTWGLYSWATKTDGE